MYARSPKKLYPPRPPFLPIEKQALQSGLRELLPNPEQRDVMVDPVMIDRSRDGLRIHAGIGRFERPYRHLLALVLEAAE